jgi:hypothetical protein
VLATDYAPFEGTLLRRADGAPPWQMLFLPIVHLVFVSAMVWIYAHVRLAGPPLRRGLTLGLVAWTIGQVPTWLLWYAQQPWPGTLVVKQLLLELIVSLALGITIALVAGASSAASERTVARV